MSPLRTSRCPGRMPVVLSGLAVAMLMLSILVVGASSAQDKAAPGAAPGTPAETLDRRSPRGTLAGFLEATDRRDYGRAAEYLDLGRIARASRAQAGPALARELRVVLDQTIPIDLDTLSDQPEGALDEGSPTDQALIGTVNARSGRTPLLLQRLPGPEESRVWKISGATVAQIPRLYREFGYGPLGDYLPPVFFEIRFLELALWQWLALVLVAAAAWGIGSLGAVLARRIVAPLLRRAAPMLGERLVMVGLGPLRLALAVFLFFVGSHWLNLSISAQQFFGEVEKALVIVVVAWVVLRLTDALAELATERLRGLGRPTAIAVVPLGTKVVKGVIVGLAVLAALQNIGVNVTGVLAGLGIGGLAVALAAQKTVENLFGGVTLIVDQPVRVGDFCRFGDRLGTIEEIGLRSTRVRTLDRTVVSIPNGHFSSLELENFTLRDRIWLHTTLGLRYETTPDQLRHVLVEIRRMLYAHPRVDPRPARIRFVNFGAYSLDLEIFAYVLTSDYDEFLAVQEDVYLRLMDIVAASGTGFAFPSQTTYFARDGGLDEGKRRAAEAQVKAWREDGSLCLPHFPPETVAALDGTLEYPAPGAAVGRPSGRG
jgi:MscS family membrane protein